MHSQPELRSYCQRHGILLMAYGTLGGAKGDGGILAHPVVRRVADAVHRSPAQVLLRWTHQLGVIVIPGSCNPAHILENADLASFRLSEEHMDAIGALDTGQRCWGWDEDPGAVDKPLEGDQWTE